MQLRNDLVHPLIERFDVWTDQGCASAVEHLQCSYDRIDGYVHEVRQWVEQMHETRLAAASFAPGAAFEDFVLNDVAPGGVVDRPHAGIVPAVREAVKPHSAGGWSYLEDARAWMGRHRPEQLPERYGFMAWPRVLSESLPFRLEYRLE